MSSDPTALIDRESSWPWPLHALLLFFACFFVLMSFAWEGVDRVVALVLVVATAGPSATDVLTRRRVVIGRSGITVGRVLLPWAAIERYTFRELPRARAGLLLRLTDEARAQLAPRRLGRQRGPGGELYDLYLRADGDRIVDWFERVTLHAMVASTGPMREAVEVLSAAARRAAAEVRLVTEDPLTISIRVESLEALGASVSAIVRALPEAARWDPAFDGRLMVLVGPLRLADEPGAEEALDRLRAAVSDATAARAEVEAIFADRA